MKIGFISDSHDNIAKVKSALAAFRERGVSYMFHCGDIVSPFMMPIMKEGGFEMFRAVFGNNDGEWLFLSKMVSSFGEIVKPPLFLELANLKIAVLHEPMPDYVMRALPVDIVAFGHTHEIVVQRGGPLVINPGECCGYLTGRSTVAVVDAETMEAEVITLE